jgi:hypothetical protein
LTPFQSHYFSENLLEAGIEPGPLDLQPGTLTTRPQGRSEDDDDDDHDDGDNNN